MVTWVMLACAGPTDEQPNDTDAAAEGDADTDADADADSDADTDALELATIVSHEAACEGSAPILVTVRTDGRSDRGRLFMASGETGVGENHPLDVVDEEPGGLWTNLAIELPQASSMDDQAAGISTVFSCGFITQNLLTFVVRIYDEPGNLQDCIAWGADPEGVIAGDYATDEPVVDAQELAGCELR